MEKDTAPSNAAAANAGLHVEGLALSTAERNDPVVVTHRSLEAISLAALRVGRLLMESGAHSSVVRANTLAVAHTLGAEGTEFRVGYASLTLTLRHGPNSITRMAAVGPLDVNQRLERALRLLVRRVLDSPAPSPQALQGHIDTIEQSTPRYPLLIVAVAVGLACAAFSVLLGGDARTALAVLPVAALAQAGRDLLRKRHFNPYLTLILLAFGGALSSCLLATAFGSATPATAMIGPTLLLVPGVVAINGIGDILEGRPTVGAARMVVVATIMLFLALGVWNATFLLETGPLLVDPPPEYISAGEPMP